MAVGLVKTALRAAYARLVPYDLRLGVGHIPFSTRLRTEYRQVLASVRASQTWSTDERASRQLHLLRATVIHAVQYVPFYRRFSVETGFSPAHDLLTLDDLGRLPMVSKHDLQNNIADFLSSAHGPRDRYYATTGGSTGQPFGFYLPRGLSEAREAAFLQAYRQTFGCSNQDFSMVLGGAFVGDSTKRSGLLRFNPLWREMAVSSYHLTDFHAPGLLHALCRFAPTYLEGYPSALFQLAQLAKARSDFQPPPLKAIFCRSENLYDHQRQILIDTFRAPVGSWYGSAERVVLGTECPEISGAYHFMPQYGLVELLRPNGAAVDCGQSGEIVATGFLNPVMPFIRYRTQDLATLAPDQSCQCGSHFQSVVTIDGRLQELAVSQTGRTISMAAINFHSDVFDSLLQFQFRQTAPGHLTFRYHSRAPLTQHQSTHIRAELMNKLGEGFYLALEPATTFVKSPRGKHRFLDQRLRVANSD